MAFITSPGLIRFECYVAHCHLETLFHRKGRRLVATGPYGTVRHPNYTGIEFLYIDWECSSRGVWRMESEVLDTFPRRLAARGDVIGFLYTRIPLEDEVLKNLFKGEWEILARRLQ